MKNIILTLLILFLLAVSFSGCISEDGGNDRIKAAVTIAPLGDFVRAVGGDRVDVTVLVPPGAEPHSFEPAPSQVRQIERADIYVINGAGLETWVSSLLRVNENMSVVDASEGINLIYGGSGSEEAGGPDPHIWLSVRNARVMVENICSGLIQADPAGREVYIANRDAYIRDLQALDSHLNSTFAGKEGRKFIVLHPAWSYFARDYGLEEIAINLEEKEPGPRYLSDVIDTAKSNGIKTIFVEPQFNPRHAEVIADEIGGSVVVLDPLAENYIDNMGSVAAKIAEGLGG